MDITILVIFVLVYLGMILGRVPGLALDRTGIALLGGVALIAAGKLSLRDAWLSVDVPTMALLLGLMVVSAQFRLGGLYDALTRRLADAAAGPAGMLALLIASAGALSAVLGNDIVCLAIAPVLVEGCIRRRLDPVPFLLGLACAANVGSVATLIGNPQNILVGETLRLSFAGYMLQAAVPAALGLAVVWGVLCLSVRSRWTRELAGAPVEAAPFNAWQTGKGAVLLVGLIAVFLLTDWPREVVALAAAGLLLMSRRMHTRHMLGEVDWQLLVLFAGLFVVNRALADSGMLQSAMDHAAARGIDLAQPGVLFVITAGLSNLVSNVPAVMLLLPAAAMPEAHPQSGAILAIASTLAGNLIIVGSIANIIVVDQARRMGVGIGWMAHARVGVPVTLITLAIAAGWLWLCASWLG